MVIQTYVPTVYQTIEAGTEEMSMDPHYYDLMNISFEMLTT